ncbi:hypothetical protein BOO91_12045 [Vibrio navarrensis]|uniref:hypothetical protein n=1 Tax=Vibrio TaxID=662 RepID=UPI0005EF6412|nr:MULTISPECIES: hypothetical protein [Vibrio]KJR21695.1 membrane protein [Vibrio sp. S234-5]MBE3652305.1 hypothetical protein [Vibrio navarrensis]MBE3661658.1 hypothetical protein [Vibrio navarrensis]
MQHTTKWKVTPLAVILAALFSTSALADEDNTVDNSGAESTKTEESASCFVCNVSGAVSLSYDTNIYNKDDHRSVRNLSWSGDLSYKLSSNTKVYFSTGGYRAFEDETGTYATDSVLGLSYSNLYNFGETGKIGASGQFTIPTSESSEKDELQTAFRLSVPVALTAWDIDFSISPRLRKNFHKYKTAGGKSLTEWTYSLSTSVSKSWESFSAGVSILGGNTISYQGTRRSSWSYGASVWGAYSFSDNWSASLEAATSGVYQDAERGTLGNIDLFDQDKASYIATLTFSF